MKTLKARLRTYLWYTWRGKVTASHLDCADFIRVGEDNMANIPRHIAVALSIENNGRCTRKGGLSVSLEGSVRVYVGGLTTRGVL